jgi:anti-sigma regulatory factor (Ser/Thr protein kinase)
MTAQPLGLAGHALSRMGWGWLAPAVAMAAAASGVRQRTPGLAPTDWTCFPRLAMRTVGPDTRSVGTARDFCLSTMRRWGVTDRQDDMAVVVSELLTNALRHAVPQAGPPPGTPHGSPDGPAGGTGRSRWPVRLGLVQPGQFVLCAVADPSPRPPQPKEPDYLAESGRGLHVISALSDRWGSTVPTDAGKVVWALFSVRLERQPPDWGWFATRRQAHPEARSAV